MKHEPITKIIDRLERLLWNNEGKWQGSWSGLCRRMDAMDQDVFIAVDVMVCANAVQASFVHDQVSLLLLLGSKDL